MPLHDLLEEVPAERTFLRECTAQEKCYSRSTRSVNRYHDPPSRQGSTFSNMHQISLHLAFLENGRLAESLKRKHPGPKNPHGSRSVRREMWKIRMGNSIRLLGTPSNPVCPRFFSRSPGSLPCMRSRRANPAARGHWPDLEPALSLESNVRQFSRLNSNR
jgi:hypothetical protein